MFPDSFEIQIFLQTLAMIHAIEMINNSTLLSGVTLGYEIYDTCAEVTKAMASALRFLSKSNTSKDIVTMYQELRQSPEPATLRCQWQFRGYWLCN